LRNSTSFAGIIGSVELGTVVEKELTGEVMAVLDSGKQVG